MTFLPWVMKDFNRSREGSQSRIKGQLLTTFFLLVVQVYHEISEVFNIADVGADTLISRVQEYETENCL